MQHRGHRGVAVILSGIGLLLLPTREMLILSLSVFAGSLTPNYLRERASVQGRGLGHTIWFIGFISILYFLLVALSLQLWQSLIRQTVSGMPFEGQIIHIAILVSSGVAIGGFVHILVDVLTEDGKEPIKPLYPMSESHISYPIVPRDNSGGDSILVITGAGLLLAAYCLEYGVPVLF